MYVEELVGPNTVNTMPMATLLAAGDHAEIRGNTAGEDPAPVLKALADAGIDMVDVTDQLLREGVDKFVEPMEKLLEGIDTKRQAIVTQRPSSIDASLPDDVEPRVAARVKQAAQEDVARRIWRKDDTLWGPAGQPEVANRLGWLTVTEHMREELGDLQAFAEAVRDEGVKDVVLLGMGGSSLAPEVIRRSFGEQGGWPSLHVLDSTDAGAVRSVAGRPSTSTTRSSSSPRSRAARSRRCRCSSTSGRCARTATRSSPSPTRARAWRSSRASTASGAPSSTTPTSAGATARCRSSASCPRRSWAPTWPGCCTPPAWPSTTARASSPATCRAGCGWGSRGASWRRPAATS